MSKELNQYQRERVAELIEQGFTSGIEGDFSWELKYNVNEDVCPNCGEQMEEQNTGTEKIMVCRECDTSVDSDGGAI
jgi:formamidopyrimidine-DNA glycosylase